MPAGWWPEIEPRPLRVLQGVWTDNVQTLTRQWWPEMETEPG